MGQEALEARGGGSCLASGRCCHGTFLTNSVLSCHSWRLYGKSLGVSRTERRGWVAHFPFSFYTHHRPDDYTLRHKRPLINKSKECTYCFEQHTMVKEHLHPSMQTHLWPKLVCSILRQHCSCHSYFFSSCMAWLLEESEAFIETERVRQNVFRDVDSC